MQKPGVWATDPGTVVQHWEGERTPSRRRVAGSPEVLGYRNGEDKQTVFVGGGKSQKKCARKPGTTQGILELREGSRWWSKRAGCRNNRLAPEPQHSVPTSSSWPLTLPLTQQHGSPSIRAPIYLCIHLLPRGLRSKALGNIPKDQGPRVKFSVSHRTIAAHHPSLMFIAARQACGRDG